MNFDKKFERILNNEFKVLKKNTIFPTDAGYSVFGCYQLENTNRGTLIKKYDRTVGIFENDRNALGWCVADKLHQYQLADELARLDSTIQRTKIDITALMNVMHKSQDFERKDIISAKLSSKQAILVDCKSRLEKCVNVTKYWQIRGFNNEIERT